MEVILLESVGCYIKKLSSATEKSQISQYIERQKALGHFLKKPISAPLRNGVHEIRPGPHRLLFFFHKGSIVVCHIFRKKSNEVPEHEIEAALSNRDKYLYGETYGR